ncbi:MAG: hypothetical protein AB4372_10790 [Xenococcus sp. (in: cyanobacteria)]
MKNPSWRNKIHNDGLSDRPSPDDELKLIEMPDSKENYYVSVNGSVYSQGGTYYISKNDVNEEDRP